MKRLVKRFAKAKKEAFVGAARRYLGAQWRHQGRLPTHMDCLGLVALSMAAVGATVVDRKGYGRTPYNFQLRASLLEHFGEPVAVGPANADLLRPADIVTLRWTKEENHIAIVTDHPEGLGLIHCWASAPGNPSGGGSVVEHRLSPEWVRRIVEGFRP